MKKPPYLPPQAGVFYFRLENNICSAFSTEGQDIPDFEEDTLNW